MPGLIDPAAIFAPLDPYPRLGLAVSGGADSLALMLLAAQYSEAPEQRRRIFVYSVDHRLRAEARDEVAFVISQAEKLGFVARPLRWEGKKPESGVQQAARQARYRLMGEAMRADHVPVLLTAHHLRDQAETVLMRLAHGSGIEGLRGMDYESEIDGVTVIRPLLGVDPAQLRQVVEAAGLMPVADPSNEDLSYERVRWRQVLPLLGELGLDAARLARFAVRMRDADAVLEKAADRAFALISLSATHGASFELRWLAGQPRAVAVRLVGKVLDHVGGGKKPYGLGAVEALTDRLLHEPFKATLHGCVIASDGSAVRVEREPGRAAAVAARSVSLHSTV